jgi:hypothetical protein
MKSIFQLWGLAQEVAANRSKFLHKLDIALSAEPEAVITGWTDDDSLYRSICSRAHKVGAKVLLWLPLFSEFDELNVYDPYVDLDGKALSRLFGGQFHFRCPASQRNRDIMLRAFFKRIANLPIDGAFLDRIRHPSFAHGTSGALGCMCPHCLACYKKADVDISAVRGAVKDASGDDPLGLTGWDGSAYRFRDSTLSLFFAVRAAMLTESAADICARLHAAGLLSALDLFPPCLGYFAGQDIAALMPYADFVKPMLYRFTGAPAGLPYEFDAYDHTFGGNGGNRQALLRLLGANTDDNYRTCMQTEIRSILGVKRRMKSGIPVYPGIEINCIPGIVNVSPEDIADNVETLRIAGAEGVVASWNLNASSERNILAFIKAVNG